MVNTNTNTNQEQKSLFKERIKFYADTPSGDVNKLFCFKIKSILSVREAIWRFMAKNWNIRSAWYEKINLTTGEVENTRINIPVEINNYAYCKINIEQMRKQGISLEKQKTYYEAALHDFNINSY